MRSATSSEGPRLVKIGQNCVHKQGWPQRCILERTAKSATHFKCESPAQDIIDYVNGIGNCSHEQ